MQIDHHHHHHDKNIVEIKNVYFSYGEEVILNNINLEVNQGDYLGVIGPNGAGKTTLLKLMLGLIQPSRGEIKLFGEDVKRFKDWPKIGYVSQKATQIDASFPMTVNGVVSMGRYAKKGLFRFLDHGDKEKVNRALKEVEMENYQNRLIGDLSGGQQQRVFLARALAGEPEVIVLDEPTSGVDIKAQEQFYTLLRKLNQEKHLTLILVSHDLDTVEREASELICLNRSVVYCGSPKEFRTHEKFLDFYKMAHPSHHH